VQAIVPRAARAAVATVVALVAVLATGSCTMVNGLRDTQSSLAAAGFADVRVDPARNAGSAIVLDVRYRTAAAAREAVTAEHLRAAEIVWREAPLRFDRVRVRATNEPATCAGRCGVELARAELQDRFGARDPGLDQDVLLELLVVGATSLLAIVLGVSLLAVRVARARASSRRNRDAWRSSNTAWRGAASPGAPTSTPAPLPGVPAAPTQPQSWQDSPSAPPAAEPTYDIWERPPS
jgi:hypothetical protein